MKAHIRTIKSSVRPTTPEPISKPHYFSFLFSFLVKRKMHSTKKSASLTAALSCSSDDGPPHQTSHPLEVPLQLPQQSIMEFPPYEWWQLYSSTTTLLHIESFGTGEGATSESRGKARNEMIKAKQIRKENIQKIRGWELQYKTSEIWWVPNLAKASA